MIRYNLVEISFAFYKGYNDHYQHIVGNNEELFSSHYFVWSWPKSTGFVIILNKTKSLLKEENPHCSSLQSNDTSDLILAR